MESEYNKRTVFTWNAVYDVLVQECGAKEKWRDSFVECAIRGFRECRFQGDLGLGGKLWQKADHLLKVTCYIEDRTEERDAMIERANARLFWL